MYVLTPRRSSIRGASRRIKNTYITINQTTPNPRATHLVPSAGVRRGHELEDGVARDASHGGESHQPANEVSPTRELVVHVLRRRPHYHIEHKHTLWYRGRERHVYRHG